MPWPSQGYRSPGTGSISSAVTEGFKPVCFYHPFQPSLRKVTGHRQGNSEHRWPGTGISGQCRHPWASPVSLVPATASEHALGRLEHKMNPSNGNTGGRHVERRLNLP